MLAPTMGVQGLALAFSISAIFNLTLLLGVLHWQLKGFDDRVVLFSLLRIVFAAMVGGIVVQILKYPVATIVDMRRFWGVFIQLVVAGGGGVLVYALIAWMLGSDEIIAIKNYLPKKPKLEELPPGTDTSRFEGLVE